jgi:hypothetical protein
MATVHHININKKTRKSPSEPPMKISVNIVGKTSEMTMMLSGSFDSTITRGGLLELLSQLKQLAETGSLPPDSPFDFAFMPTKKAKK